MGIFAGILAFFAKINWKGVLQFILDNWVWFLVGLLVFMVWHRGNKIDDLQASLDEEKQKITDYKISIDTLSETLENNKDVLELCHKANLANLASAIEMRDKVEKAAVKIKRLQSESDAEVGKIGQEVNAMRGQDMVCRYLDDPLPNNFSVWVRQ